MLIGTIQKFTLLKLVSPTWYKFWVNGQGLTTLNGEICSQGLQIKSHWRAVALSLECIYMNSAHYRCLRSACCLRRDRIKAYSAMVIKEPIYTDYFEPRLNWRWMEMYKFPSYRLGGNVITTFFTKMLKGYDRCSLIGFGQCGGLRKIVKKSCSYDISRLPRRYAKKSIWLPHFTPGCSRPFELE